MTNENSTNNIFWTSVFSTSWDEDDRTEEWWRAHMMTTTDYMDVWTESVNRRMTSRVFLFKHMKCRHSVSLTVKAAFFLETD